MGWNPFSWFNNRGGGMDDGGGGVSTWDSDSDKTTTYDNWSKYDAGQPSGSWVGDGGYKTSWSDAFRAADKWNQGQKGDYNYPGYMSKGPMNWPTSGVTKVGANSTLVDPTASWWNKYQIQHHPQKQGSGIGGMIGSIAGAALGNVVAPGIGGKIGASIGGSVGSSF